jgi:hypothetical protein
MRTLRIAAVFLTCMCCQVSAQDRSLVAAQELVKLTTDQTMNDTIAAMTEPLWKSIQPSFQGKADAGTQEEIRNELNRVMQKYLDQAMAKAPAIYARYFTESEIREIIAFYKMPIGQKTLRQMPKVMGEVTSSLLLPMMVPMQAELQTSVASILRKHNVQP